MLFSALAAVAGLALPLLTAAAPAIEFLDAASKRSFNPGPAIKQNFPDPCYIQVGKTYYAYATNNGKQNIPYATSTDFKTWHYQTGKDALKSAGAWSNGEDIWAPSVVQLDDGSFVMYYAARLKSNTKYHCIGTATSKTPQGPFTPSKDYFTCHVSQGGAIDASGFKDADGTRYVVYKIDGNNIGHGGTCNNGVAPIVPTPIMIQKVGKNGITRSGSAQQILVNGQYDGPDVEAPALARVKDSSCTGGWLYFLFFSSNCYDSSFYDVSYAYSTHGVLNGGKDYTKAKTPLLLTGADGGKLYAPGGIDVPSDLGQSQKVVWHADLGKTPDTRQMWSGSLKVDAKNRKITI